MDATSSGSDGVEFKMSSRVVPSAHKARNAVARSMRWRAANRARQRRMTDSSDTHGIIQPRDARSSISTPSPNSAVAVSYRCLSEKLSQGERVEKTRRLPREEFKRGRILKKLEVPETAAGGGAAAAAAPETKKLTGSAKPAAPGLQPRRRRHAVSALPLLAPSFLARASCCITFG